MKIAYRYQKRGKDRAGSLVLLTYSRVLVYPCPRLGVDHGAYQTQLGPPGPQSLGGLARCHLIRWIAGQPIIGLLHRRISHMHHVLFMFCVVSHLDSRPISTRKLPPAAGHVAVTSAFSTPFNKLTLCTGIPVRVLNAGSKRLPRSVA